MQRLIRYAALVTTLLAALGGGAAQGQALSPYVMQKISQPGSAINYAQGINNSGVAVGAADPGGSFSTIFFRAAVFSPAAPVSGPGCITPASIPSSLRASSLISSSTANRKS